MATCVIKTQHCTLLSRLYLFHEKDKKQQQQLTRRNARQHALMTRSIHLHRHSVLTVSFTALVHCPITSAQIGLVINNHVQEFCYSYD